MHAHASDAKLTRAGSAKFFIKDDGSTVVQNRGTLTELEIRKIQAFIQANYLDMYKKWAEYSNNGFFGEGR
jgi:hypothetical protein